MTRGSPGLARPADTLAPLEVPGRLERLRQLLAQVQADAVLVTERANVRYLSGFSGSAGDMLVGPDLALLVTDGRYRTQAAEQLEASGLSDEVELSVGKVPEQRAAVSAAVARCGAKRVGLEAESVTWGAKRRFAELLAPAELVPTEGLVERLRQAKDAGELSRMAHAAYIADEALALVVGMLEEGRSEEEIALALDTEMRRLGAEDRAFDTIVASGPNAAKPHARPTPRRVRRGDTVVIDFGAVYDGYRSDMTRTFLVGVEPDSQMAEVYSVVLASQAAGLAEVRAGVSAGDVDRACREVIAGAGWAQAFEHGTGHGVGLDIHEAPSVSEGSTAILAPGFVVTVEPGVYLPGAGGVRIEDTVVVTEEGCRPLTSYGKDPSPGASP